ncbi:MAG: DNA gyrase subunit A [archaeon]
MTNTPSQEPSVPHESRILKEIVEQKMKSAYIDYAMSVIVNRALPDVRDGLKPVHRRVLYAMNDLDLAHNKAHKKCARIVGEVLGKYHPHGDSAVYETLVRMAQDFSLRYPLVDGQGNFGSIDGDNAAAMRYTEARLSKIAGEMLLDIDKETVDFKDNFDATLQEPDVLPSRIPNLIMNGSNGIAVGMATNIPPHNLQEIGKAIIALIDNPELSVAEIITHVQGPDFPTGGIVAGRSGIVSAYTTGRGIIQLKGVMQVHEVKEKKRIIISEIPYQVNKAQLIEEIAGLVRDKKITDISDMRDESNQEGIRIVLELKRDAHPDIVMNVLYKFSRMQVSYSINMLALVDNEPKLLSLKHALVHYIDHRKIIVVRKAQFELKKAQERAHILEGLQKALQHIDAVVALIKKAAKVEDAKQKLIAEYGLSDVQAQAILEMRLQRIAQLEQEKIVQEHQGLVKTIRQLQHLLSHDEAIRDVMKQDLVEVMKLYGDDRKTVISDEDESLELEELIPDTMQVITLTRSGYIKRTALDIFKVQRRGGKGVIGTDKKDEDVVEHIFVASTRASLLIFTDKGLVHWLKIWKIPEGNRYGKGKALINLVELDKEQVTAVIPVKEFTDKECLIMATKRGVVKKTNLNEYANPRRGGIKAIAFDEGDVLVNVIKTKGNATLILATKKGMASKFSEHDVRSVGRTARGVRGIRLRQGDAVVGMVIGEDTKKLLTVTEHGFGKKTLISEYRCINRGGSGVINIRCGERNGPVACVRSITDTDELLFVSKNGIMIRTSAADIPTVGRNTQGVRIMKLDQGDIVVSAAKIYGE